jgi:hypothetical protein
MLGLPKTSNLEAAPSEGSHLESQIQRKLGNRINNLRVRWQEDGWVLQGSAASYHAKQLAQEALLDATPIQLRANQIKVLAQPVPSNTWAFIS